ncbi:MAG: SDR family NAD(P)-dependent oxidoreductase [Treponema sp.]|jgi:sorbitol-6-phosphate 2-dehydrogenase|nr:SDR family NAD(P)-dependent oxidoreductase [Treponema sp.]
MEKTERNPAALTALAPLIRGLYINTGRYPWVVMQSPPGETEIPSEALVIEIGPVQTADTGLDTGYAAKILQDTYTAWEFDRAPAGAEAAGRTEVSKKAPSCVVVKDADTIQGIYWIDRDFDAVQKRLETRDDSLLTEKIEKIEKVIEKKPSPVCNAAQRAAVVDHKIALVTGGAQGIGAAIVQSLAVSGAVVFIADRNREGAETLANQINATEKRTAAIPVEVNVAEEASVEALFTTVAKTTGGLDICISNAGVLRAGSVLEQRLEDFTFVTDINYTGFFLVAKYAGRLFREQHRTAPHWKTDLIQINSKSGLEGSTRNAAYAGGKFGGIGLVESFALELVDYNIKVNAICPGNFFDGPLWSDPEKGLFVQYLRAGKVPGARHIADVKAYYEAKVPMKRGCTGPDVMRAIYYIIEQEYETGQAVPVTGGQVMLH